MKNNRKLCIYVALIVIGEFFIMLDAGFIGYSMEHGIRYALEKWIFWVLLILGVCFRYWAEKFKS